MLGHKGTSNGFLGKKGVPSHTLIGGLNKGHVRQMADKVREMVAQAPKYGSLEKK
jgi:hypothetical protein